MITTDYIVCRGITIENICGKIRIAFVRCPKCHCWMSLYKGDLDSDGRTRHPKECTCGFIDSVTLDEWNE